MIAITPENAREFQKRSVEARKRNKQRAQVVPEEPDIHAAIKQEIADVLTRMSRATSNKTKAQLSLVLERLWNMVYPKAGSRKPPRDSQRKPLPTAQHTWKMSTPVSTDTAEQ